jgi:hypothetical protein
MLEIKLILKKILRSEMLEFTASMEELPAGNDNIVLNPGRQTEYSTYVMQ